jgi:nitrate/TMAO reductase-like tetraheme cytochrome c subunit
MSPLSRFRHVRNPLTLFGIWLAIVSAILFLVVFFADLFGLVHNPYLGILFFLVLPGFFVLGLLLVPLGIYFSRRREQRGLQAAEYEWPVWDFNLPTYRRAAALILGATLVNVLVISLAAYRGVEYMDSPQFCGQVCHTVMRPEFTAYQNGPHARVACVSCHIGPGAPWFVKSKLSGTRQLFAVALKTYPTPVPSPVMNLRPARETCEECHWPEKFTGDRIRTVREFADDEAVSEATATLRLHVGSGSEKLGATGIHWHMAPSTRVTYITTDPKRQVIPYVKVEDGNGRVLEYRAPGVTEEQLARGERRQMDCMDCHNRPSHRFDSTPEAAVNDALATGAIPRSLPFARRETVAALKATYPSQDAAAEAIRRRLTNFYRAELKDRFAARQKDVERAVAAAQGIYRRNIFPDMNVTWGTYPNNLGHSDFPGCFRCHDDSHTAPDGTAIRQDCELCHKQE